MQEQTRIPYVLIDGRFEATPAALRLLGDILGLRARGEQLAKYVEDTFAEIDAALKAIPDEERPRVYLARDPDALKSVWSVPSTPRSSNGRAVATWRGPPARAALYAHPWNK